jgi:hypothetical protein
MVRGKEVIDELPLGVRSLVLAHEEDVGGELEVLPTTITPDRDHSSGWAEELFTR